MEIQQQEINGTGIRLALHDNGKEIARVRLYFIENDLRSQPYALVEDLFVDEAYRGQGLGRMMMEQAIAEARKAGCYKILATSRHSREQVHEFYLKLGFQEWGKEFRMEL